METRRNCFLAVGHTGLRLFSADGNTWSDAQTGKEGEVYRAAAFGNGRAVAVGNYGGVNIFAASRDGKEWSTSTRDGKYALFVRGLGFGKDQFLAIGGDPGAVGASRPFETHSTDGATWSELREFGGKNILRRLAYGNDRFVGVGDRGRRAASPDGREWKDAPDVKAIDTLVDVAFGNGVFVGVGLHGLRMTSEDGLVWTERQVGEEGEHLNSVVWAGERFVAVGQGATYISADGKTWRRTANSGAPLTVAYGGGVFVGASWKGRLLRSEDGVAWREVHKCPHHIEAVAFGTIG
jgi:hypothetical protein